MKKLLSIALLFFVCSTSGCKEQERTRDIVIRDFNKGISRLDLTPEQKGKWDAVIDSIYTLHDRTEGGWGQYATKGKGLSFAYPGHYYVASHSDKPASDLVMNYVNLNVNDYRRVIKVHIQIHDRIEEFDDSLDMSTRRKFRSYFRDSWMWVYDEMTKKMDQSLDKELAGVRSYTDNLNLTNDQKTLINTYLAEIDAARRQTAEVKNKGRSDLWKMMSSPEIPWKDNPMMCKKYFEAYSNTLYTYSDAIQKIEKILSAEQQAGFSNAVYNRYRLELHKLAGYYK
jgi:hypothetical protein